MEESIVDILERVLKNQEAIRELETTNASLCKTWYTDMPDAIYQIGDIVVPSDIGASCVAHKDKQMKIVAIKVATNYGYFLNQSARIVYVCKVMKTNGDPSKVSSEFWFSPKDKTMDGIRYG